MTDDSLKELAGKRVDARIGFYIHAGVFAVVMTLLWAINLSTESGTLWAKWPTLGWGFGLCGHGAGVVLSQREGSGVRDRMIQAEVDKLQHDGHEIDQPD